MNYKVSKTTARYLDSLRALLNFQNALELIDDEIKGEGNGKLDEEIDEALTMLYNYIYSKLQNEIACNIGVITKSDEMEI